MDLGKLTFASLVLGFFQSTLPVEITILYGFIGLTISIGLFKLALELFKNIDYAN